MKKMPTLFRRDFADRRRAIMLDQVHPDAEWVFTDPGVEAVRKYDGTCVLVRDLVIDGIPAGGMLEVLVRREVKPGKPIPDGFELAETDTRTGKRVGWVPFDESFNFKGPMDEALDAAGDDLTPGTYELCGPKVNGNPERLLAHRLLPHADADVWGRISAPAGVSLDGNWGRPLATGLIVDEVRRVALLGWEGLIFRHPDGRMAKLKGKDLPR